MNIKVTGHSQILGTTHYAIEISYQGQVWTCELRYSELRAAHDEFQTANSGKKSPDFPPKAYFSTNSPEFIEKRKKQLENYFSTLIKLNEKVNYKMKSWIDFFMSNRKEEQTLPTVPTPVIVPQASQNAENLLMEDFKRNIFTLENTFFKEINRSVTKIDLKDPSLKPMSHITEKEDFDESMINSLLDVCFDLDKLLQDRKKKEELLSLSKEEIFAPFKYKKP